MCETFNRVGDCNTCGVPENLVFKVHRELEPPEIPSFHTGGVIKKDSNGLALLHKGAGQFMAAVDPADKNSTTIVILGTKRTDKDILEIC